MLPLRGVDDLGLECEYYFKEMLCSSQAVFWQKCGCAVISIDCDLFL
jgi:hypothetical protein